MARSCSPPAIPMLCGTRHCLRGWDWRLKGRSVMSRTVGLPILPDVPTITNMKRRLSELQAIFDGLDREHLRRQRRTIDAFVEAGSRVTAVVDGRQLVDFSSNDYLGLARHPAVAAAMSECAQRCGSGSGASHLVTGHAAEHTRLEEELAAFTGRERALLFSTGYMANLAVMTTLADRSETVLLDRLSHASLIDGGLLSGARFKRFAHADAGAAESAISGSTSVLATDGVFSMDGDVGPLVDLA